MEAAVPLCHLWHQLLGMRGPGCRRNKRRMEHELEDTMKGVQLMHRPSMLVNAGTCPSTSTSPSSC